MEQPRPGGTTFMIVVKTSRPGKYAWPQLLQNNYHVLFLTPHLTPADLSPVLTLWKGNCETFWWKTSCFMSNDRLKLQETPFSKGSLTIFYMRMVLTQQVRHLWVASDITISLHIIMCQSDAQFWPLLSPATLSIPNLFYLGCWVARSLVQQLTRHDWKWGSEPISAVLQCRANSW